MADVGPKLVRDMTIVKFFHTSAVQRLSQVRTSTFWLVLLALAVASAAEARPYRLMWDGNVDGVTGGYYVYYGTAPGAYQPVGGIDAGNVTEFQVNLTPGTTYYFQVRAYNYSGTLGAPSAELSFVVPNTAPVLTNPGGLTNAAGDVVARQLVATDAENDGLLFTSVTGLPPGLSASVTGLISGTISSGGAGTYSVTATVSDGSAQDVEVFSWQVTAPQPRLSIGNVSVSEGNSGTSVATFTVTLSPVNTSQTVTVNYATANGTATLANNDYAAASGTLTFAPSTATRTLSVTIVGDTVVEPNETFFVNLSGAVNAAIATAQAIGTIQNDDAVVPAVSVTSTSVPPGGLIQFVVSNGPANRLDWVSLSTTSAGDNTYLDWKYLNGQRTAPLTGVSGATLQFTAPTTPGTYNIRFFTDNRLVKLATSATITVASAPTLTIGDITVTEGNSGTSVATFTVTLSPVNTSQTVTVNYATADGTATIANNDYAASSGTLTFAPSTATRTLSVSIVGDTVVEPNETFMVNLSGAANAQIGDAQAIGTIANDDIGTTGGPAVTLSSTTVQPGAAIQFVVNGGPANPMDWVSLSQTSAPDNTYLAWKYLNGLGTAPVTGVSGATLQFTAPSTPGTYNVRFYADNRLTKLATSATITVSAAPLQPTLTIGDVSLTEGNGGTSVATFTVTLSPVNASQTVTVNYATADGTATVANNDYAAASGTLTFAPSTATRTLSVTINGDSVVEPSEMFFVNLSGATNALIGDAQAVGNIANDDVAPGGPAVSLTSTTVRVGAAIQFVVSGGPANPMDWVSLSLASAPDSTYLTWKYLNGLGTAPMVGVTGATLQFAAPLTPGTYNIRFFADNRVANKLATSATITVTP